MFNNYNGCAGHFEELPMNNWGVIIDRAHGKNVAGKCSPDAAIGNINSPYYYYEWEWSSIICKLLKNRFEKEGIRVEFTVDPDDENEPGLDVRGKRTNRIINDNPDIHWVFLSMHSNAAADINTWSNATGFSIYTTRLENNSDILADCIIKRAEETLPLYKKHIRKYMNEYLKKDYEASFYVIKAANCPAVLSENWFHTTKSDVAWLKSERGKEVIVDFHVKGIIDYFNLKENKEI